MKLFKKAEHLSLYLNSRSAEGISVGFVPTMGALHRGHLSLIQAAKDTNDLTVCSIFVNPTQFNNVNDFAKYPVTIEGDIEQLLSAGCDVLFLPSKDEIYPADYRARSYDLGQLEKVLEGEHRPGHFQGVCQVVHRLLSIVQSNDLYLGAKDYQQVKILHRLIQLLSKEDSIRLHKQPTLREADGLAMSSRNLRLSPSQREKAPVLYKVLSDIKRNFIPAHASLLEINAVNALQAEGFTLDYVTIADGDTLLSPTSDSKNYVALAAVFLDDIRLIDNLELTANK